MSQPPWWQDHWLTLCGVVEVVDNAWQNLVSSIRPPQQTRLLQTAQGKKVLITGGTSGVGYAVAQQLAAAGAHVTVTSRSSERAQSAARAITEAAQQGSPKCHVC